MAAQGGEDVYASLLLTDSYLPGALVLAHSLRDAGTKKKLAILVTLDSVSAEVMTQLKAVYDYIVPVPRIRNETPANLYLMDRPDLHSAFTKINLWKQTQFRKIVYMDADVVAYRAPDELFDLSHAFAAAPDIGWPDLFNTGVMVLSPNMGVYYALTAMGERGISFDGADQGLLNMFFRESYHRLPFTYNVAPSGHYQYVPAFRHFQSSISTVHFIGNEKPWTRGREANKGGGPFDEMVGRWWAVYNRHYRKEVTAADSQTAPKLVHYLVQGEWQPKLSYDILQPHFEHGYDDETHGHVADQVAPDHGLAPPRDQPSPNPGDLFARASAIGLQRACDTEAREEQMPAHAALSPDEYHKLGSFQPPQIPSWDAQRQPPPLDSKPEAANFPVQHYEMSCDPAPFVPPERYASPPKNMWYEVPKEAPTSARSKPPEIFPWESSRPRPTRVFADDRGTPEAPALFAALSISGAAHHSSNASTGYSDKREPQNPTMPTMRVEPAPEPWSSFTRSNAWDRVPGIDRYVDRIQKQQQTRSQGLRRGNLAGLPGQELDDEQWRGGRGFRVGHFPVDRPSLPVTLASIRRPRFWAGGGPEGLDEDQDKRGLPAAEGVPAQFDWDSTAQLQKLARQQSELLLEKLSKAVAMPTRSLPFGSEDLVAKGSADCSDPTMSLSSTTTTTTTTKPSSPQALLMPTVLSPQPKKPRSETAPVREINGNWHESAGEEEPALPCNMSASFQAEPVMIAEPSYQGPGAAFETPVLPREEDKDVMET